MSRSKGRVRPRRRGDSGGSGPVVAVTGAADGLGRALATHLSASPEVRKVVAIDAQRGDVAGVTWRVVDVRDPVVAGRLVGVDVVVHLDLDQSLQTPSRERRSYNVRGAQTVLTAAAAERVPHVVLVSSATVYGARPDNDVPLAEHSPLRADPDLGLVGDLLEIEQLAAQARRTHPGLKVTVVRPAALVAPGMDTVVTRHFESPRLLTVKGVAQRWQFCHIDDLVSALEYATLGRVEGDFAVGAEGWLEQEEAEEISGLRRIELPAAVTFGTAQRLHRLGVTPAPATDLHYVVYPWVVDCATLRDAGWRPKHDNAEALRMLLAARTGRALVGRHVGRKEATLTAAGATVAVIGAAAIVRRARRRRRGL